MLRSRSFAAMLEGLLRMPQTWERYLAANAERHLDALLDFLRIPSVSTLPEHASDVRRAAEFVAEQLRAAGVPDVELMPTAGFPVVVGRWHVADEQPTVLIYGHYDVQPAEPLELW